ncbi:MAG: DUF4040 domain-containing protein [Planctomycetes bacterium]|nr:DUF4040 domain-containing protein [Planctomycetota bacterium]
MVTWIDALLLLMVVLVGAGVVASRNLFAAAMLSGSYSLLMALVWVNMAAMDVAFTEAAVGAGVSTVLFLGTIAITGREEKREKAFHWPALLAVLLTGSALVYGTIDMPDYGDRTGSSNPVNRRIAPEYIRQVVPKTGRLDGVAQAEPGENQYHEHVPNFVTAVLADYRGFDTMFESAVIFSAGAAMVLLLRRRRDRPADRAPEETS